MASDWEPEEVTDLAEFLGRRWVLPVIAALWDGPLRRSALRRTLGPVSDKVLTRTLQDLEHRGIVARQLSDEWPPRVGYALTAQGRALAPAFREMTRWAAKAKPGQQRP